MHGDDEIERAAAEEAKERERLREIEQRAGARLERAEQLDERREELEQSRPEPE